MLPDREQTRRLRKEPPLGGFPRIYSPEAFDRLLAAQPQLRRTIAGFSTIALDHVLKSPDGSVSVWSDGRREHINLELSEDGYRHVYGREPIADELFTFPTNLYRNRIMGYAWSIREAFKEIEPERTLDEINSLLVPVSIDLNLPLTTLGTIPARTYGELITSLEFPSTWNTARIYNYQTSLDRLYSLGFSSPENFFRFLREITRRGGVQIVYGPADEFMRFLDQQTRPAGQIDDASIEVFSSIPSELVLAIIPLGKHERQALLGEE